MAHDYLEEVHHLVTQMIPDERGTVTVTFPAALRRLLIITRRTEAVVRRSETRERTLIAAVEALAASSNANQTEVMTAVNAALAAITELDDDLPEGDTAPEPPTPVTP